MKIQSNLQELLRISDKVRETKWFRQTMHGDKDEATKNLERHLNAYPHREAEHIVVSMTCGNPTEAALIVNEMARLFVTNMERLRSRASAGSSSNSRPARAPWREKSPTASGPCRMCGRDRNLRPGKTRGPLFPAHDHASPERPGVAGEPDDPGDHTASGRHRQPQATGRRTPSPCRSSTRSSRTP